MSSVPLYFPSCEECLLTISEVKGDYSLGSPIALGIFTPTRSKHQMAKACDTVPTPEYFLGLFSQKQHQGYIENESFYFKKRHLTFGFFSGTYWEQDGGMIFSKCESFVVFYFSCKRGEKQPRYLLSCYSFLVGVTRFDPSFVQLFVIFGFGEHTTASYSYLYLPSFVYSGGLNPGEYASSQKLQGRDAPETEADLTGVCSYCFLVDEYS